MCIWAFISFCVRHLELLHLLLVGGRGGGTLPAHGCAVWAGTEEHPGLRLHRGAPWGKHPGTQLSFCTGAVPQQAPLLEFTQLSYQGLSPDKSIQQWSRNSRTYLVHSSLAVAAGVVPSTHTIRLAQRAFIMRELLQPFYGHDSDRV